MKALYITSLHKFSGKTAVCLALGRRFQREGYTVGYFKPVSAHPWEPIPGRAHDEDADFVRRTLGLEESLVDMVGVVLSPTLVEEMEAGQRSGDLAQQDLAQQDLAQQDLAQQDLAQQRAAQPLTRDLMAEVQAAYERVRAGKDIMLIEGGASLREGISLGVDPTHVAQTLDVQALAMVRFRNYLSMMDACMEAYRHLGTRLLGTFINAVPDEAQDFIAQTTRPYLEDHGIPLFGAMPQREQLQAISVGELAEVLDGKFLALPEKENVLIEQLIVGAMSVEQALPRIRRIPGTKAIITGGDRADIQLASLETATQCLILTGNLRPVPEVLRRAEQMGVPVLLVRQNTMETVDAIEDVFGKTRLGQAAKLEAFESLLEAHFDFERLYENLGLK